MRVTKAAEGDVDPLDQLPLEDEEVAPLWEDEAGASDPAEPDEDADAEAPADEPDVEPAEEGRSHEEGMVARDSEPAADDAATDQEAPDEVASDVPADGQDGAQDAPHEATVVAQAAQDTPQEVFVQFAHEGSSADDTRVFVGDDDAWDMDEATAQGYVSRAWSGRAYETSRRGDPHGSAGPSRQLIISLVALAAGLLLVGIFRALMPHEQATDVTDTSTTSAGVSERDAAAVVASLDGWWKTDRSLDGRYWRIEDGLMETYAADGKLASQVLLDTSSIEYLSEGPGGIEGAGYYLRDVAYFLVDGDADTLHALTGDGMADEGANLLRAETPDFASGGSSNADDDADADEGADADGDADADAGEYMLPESATRVYEASELEQLSDYDLFVARNEIYARHGYVFEAGELSEHFSSKSWYHPSDVFNEGALNEVERANVSAILQVEQARGSQYL